MYNAVAISNTVKNYIVDTYKISEKMITTIPRGCDANTFNKESAPDSWITKWYEEYPQTSNKIILTLPTRISKWKGVDSFIELISLLNDDNYHGLIVGPAAKSKQKYLKDKDIEHIIIDGGSVDETLSIIKKLQKNFSWISCMSSIRIINTTMIKFF